jgi:hypothetical protein
MTLAALNFSDPIMLMGLLAAGIPVLLHLLNRVRAPVVQFPTLRFLRVTAQKTSRRRHVQHFLLLLMRMAVFALIAMAIAGPLVHGGSPLLAYGMLALLLVGLAVMAIMAVMLASALERPKGPTARAIADGITRAVPPGLNDPVRPPNRLRQLGLPALVMIVALLAALAGLFGLSTNQFFPTMGGSYNGTSTACVIILDNSQSMLAHDGNETRLAHALRQTHALLNRVIRPAQMAVLLTNPGSKPIPEALSANRLGVLTGLLHVTSIGRAMPMRELVARAVALLDQSKEPDKMLFLLSDFAGPASSDVQAFAPLKHNPSIALVLMPQEFSRPDDVAISGIKILSGQPVVGSRISIGGTVLNNGPTAVVPEFHLLVDAVPVAHSQTKVELGPAGSQDSRGAIKIAHLLTHAGYHVLTLALRRSSHVLTWANRRSVSLNVAKQVNALVIGSSPTLQADSTAFYVDAALAPFSGPGTADHAGQPVWSIVPTYAAAQAASALPLARYGAVFICDVPRVGSSLADKLSQYVRSGGRICWFLGSAVDSVEYNRVIWNTRHLLPAPIAGPVVRQTGSSVDWIDIRSHIFANLFKNQNPFRRIVVVGRWGFDAAAAPLGHVLSKLENNATFLTQQRQGNGQIYTFMTAPGGGWTNLANTSLFLPMVVRMALGNAADLARTTSFGPGQVVAIPMPAVAAGTSVEVDIPHNAGPVNVPCSKNAAGLPQWIFNRTERTGIYQWHSFNHQYAGEFVVNPPGDEANLLPVSAAVLAKEAPKGQPVFIASSLTELLQELAKISQGTSLMPGVLAIVLILAVLEALFANRYKPTEENVDTDLITSPAASSAAAQ